MVATVSMDNPVFRSFAFYAAACIAKMFILTGMTVFQRMSRNIFVNKEDAQIAGSHVKVVLNDATVDRIMRNHRNDLENIPAFIFVGALYVLIGPSFGSALWHFRLFFFSRVIHTVAYQFALPQPSRALAFTVGLLVTISMIVQVLSATM